jgi:hypothetical protein
MTDWPTAPRFFRCETADPRPGFRELNGRDGLTMRKTKSMTEVLGKLRNTHEIRSSDPIG